MRTLTKRVAAIVLSAIILVSALGFTNNVNGNGNGNENNGTPPADIVIISRPAPTPQEPGKRILIAIRAQELPSHIKQGDLILPYNDEIAKWIGWEDAGGF